MSPPAQAGVNDPEIIIYRVSGVVDDGNVLATSFHCSNFSGVDENVRVVVRSPIGTLRANVAAVVSHLNTIVWSTRDVFIYGAEVLLPTGTLGSGTAAIAATSANVTCTAMEVQSNVTNAVGIALHMTRFSPAPGTQE